MTDPAATVPFFPPVAPTSADEPGPDDVLVDVAWLGPPSRQRPGLVPMSVLLGWSTSTAVLIEGARAHPDGVVLRFVVQLDEPRREARRRVMAQLELTHGRGQLDLDLPPGGLRWGLEMSDGRRVTTVDDWSPWNALPDGVSPQDWTPDRPVLTGLSRPTAWGATWSRDVWLWPLPPPGPLTLVCEWPDRGIAQTTTVADAGQLRDAAALAGPFWADPPAP